MEAIYKDGTYYVTGKTYNFKNKIMAQLEGVWDSNTNSWRVEKEITGGIQELNKILTLWETIECKKSKSKKEVKAAAKLQRTKIRKNIPKNLELEEIQTYITTTLAKNTTPCAENMFYLGVECYPTTSSTYAESKRLKNEHDKYNIYVCSFTCYGNGGNEYLVEVKKFLNDRKIPFFVQFCGGE